MEQGGLQHQYFLQQLCVCCYVVYVDRLLHVAKHCTDPLGWGQLQQAAGGQYRAEAGAKKAGAAAGQQDVATQSPKRLRFGRKSPCSLRMHSEPHTDQCTCNRAFQLSASADGVLGATVDHGRERAALLAM